MNNSQSIDYIARVRKVLQFIRTVCDDFEIYGTTKAGALDLIYENATYALAMLSLMNKSRTNDCAENTPTKPQN